MSLADILSRRGALISPSTEETSASTQCSSGALFEPRACARRIARLELGLDHYHAFADADILLAASASGIVDGESALAKLFVAPELAVVLDYDLEECVGSTLCFERFVERNGAGGVLVVVCLVDFLVAEPDEDSDISILREPICADEGNECCA